MILNIITEPNPILHQKTRDLTAEEIKSKEIQDLIKNMIPTMRIKDGVGLAAPQVGRPLRITVIAKEYNINKNEDLVLINATWKKKGLFKEWDEEGCLSVPNSYGRVKRRKKIKVTALDENGKPINFTAKDFLARIIQHEVDHLNGILFIEKAKDIRKIYRE